MNKDFKKLLKEAERQGWRVEEGGKNYLLWPPDKSQSMVTVAKTASDVKAIHNTIGRMKQRGFKWPPKR